MGRRQKLISSRSARTVKIIFPTCNTCKTIIASKYYIMLTTPHLLIGMYLVSSNSSLGLGLLAAFLSHFLFDFCFPHWNPHLYTEKKQKGKISKNSVLVIAFDLLLSASLFFVISLPFLLKNDWQKVIFLMLGGFLAVLPDIMEIPYYFLNYKNKFLKKYVLFEHQHQLDTTPFWGLLTQAIISLVAFYLLLKLR